MTATKVRQESFVSPASDDSLGLAKNAAEAAIAEKALQPVLVDVSGRASYADYLLVLSGRSMRQVEAIAEHLRQAMKRQGCECLSQEGERDGHWMLLDFGALVIHVFHHPAREYYDLEGLWDDAPRVDLEVPDDLRCVGTNAYESPIAG